MLHGGAIGTRYEYHAASGTIVEHREQDVELLLELNKRQQRRGDGYTKSRDLRWIASVPMIVVEIWKNTLGVNALDKNDDKKVLELLRDPEHRFLRTSEGRI